MSQLILKASKINIGKLLDGRMDIQEFLEDVITERFADESNYSRICFNLESYHWSDGGAPDVTDFEIADVTFNEITRSGTVDLEYVVYFYYGCEDMNSDSEQEQTLKFEIDASSSTLTLTIEEKYGRDTLDEF